MDDIAVSEADWAIRKEFQQRLKELRIETCIVFQEKWFDMQLQEGVCQSCRNDTQEPKLLNKENEADPRSFPDDLPKLSAVEEMFIARASISLEIRSYRRAKHSFRGKICYAMSTEGRVDNILPVKPADLINT